MIDADEKIVTPGFIDIHTHCDLTFKRASWKRYGAYLLPSWKGNNNYLYQGVTTVVTGNCGWGYTDINRIGVIKAVKEAIEIGRQAEVPAEKFNMKARGKIAANYYADIAVMDLKTITDHATVASPNQYSEGITHLLVNGELSIEDGVATGIRFKTVGCSIFFPLPSIRFPGTG